MFYVKIVVSAGVTIGTLIIKDPARVHLPSDSEEIKRFLTFRDRGVDFLIKKHKSNYRWKNSTGDGWADRLEELELQKTKTLLFYDEDGLPYTYSGLTNDLVKRFGFQVKNELKAPQEGRMMPWATQPSPMRYYQAEAVKSLIEARHGAISLPTGSGKSILIFNILKELRLKSVVMTPSASITDQLYREAIKLFGKKYVGKYGDGKKDLDKMFTFATGQALTRIEPGTEAWDVLSSVDVVISDESHTVPASTFEKVMLGPLSKAYYRFFVSATQMRTDGNEMILRGIIGPIVYSKEFKELVDDGYLAKISTRIFSVPAHGQPGHPDPNTETRNQLYLNPNVNKLAAQLAYKSVTLLNRPVVILIDEFSQFMMLKNYITIPFDFVHGGITNRENKNGMSLRDIVPQEYWKCDIEKSVKDFNDGKTKILIGTSAISTGVDLRPTGVLIYLQGGLSEIKVKQGVGRATRVTDTKKDAFVFDFNVIGSPTMERHLEGRRSIYEELGEVEDV